MNPTIQSGMHPDAESLTAFAEQLLPAAERDQILLHMAMCGRCREVVFLAQHAASEDQTVPAGSAVAPKKKRVSSFNGWGWMWIPATAFAGLIGVAVVQHFRHIAAETQMTAKLSPTEALRNVEPAKASATSSESQTKPTATLQKGQKASPSELRDKLQDTTQNRALDSASLSAAKDEAKQLDAKKSVEQRELVAKPAGAPVVVPPGLSEGSINGMMAVRAKSSPPGGPSAAGQLQQQSPAQQNFSQENMLRQSQNVATDAAKKPMTAGAAAASASKTATVQADTVEMSPAPAPAPATQLAVIPTTGKNYEVSSAGLAKLSKAKVWLPNGVSALSVATVASRSVALDTKGALYLSDDGGEHWQPIESQWSGRAVLVRGGPVSPPAAAKQTAPQSRFELVTDKLQTWISLDGKTWTPEPVPKK